MTRSDATYYGTGRYFFKGHQGYFGEVTDTDLVKENIFQILLTIPGERVMLPEFGSMLRYLKFEPNDETLEGQARMWTQEAIERWEDRVWFRGLDILQQEHELRLTVHVEHKFNRQLDKVIVSLPR